MGKIIYGSHTYTNTMHMPKFDTESDVPPIPGTANKPSSAPPNAREAKLKVPERNLFRRPRPGRAPARGR